MIAFGDDLERLLVARGDQRAARLALVEELVLGDLLGLGVVGDEDDFDVAVLGADELVEQEEEAARQILLHRVHRARGVHDAQHHGVGLLAHVGDQMLEGQVVVVERETPLLVLGAVGLARRHHALDPRPHRAALVEALANADLAVALALGGALGGDLAQALAFEVGELEVLEHQVDELVEADVGLVVVDARAVAGAVRLALAVALLAADHLARLRLAVALADARGGVAVDEAILLDAADRDLDDAIAILPDDRLLGDDVGDVLADRLAHLVAVPGAVAGGAVAALGVGGAEGRKMLSTGIIESLARSAGRRGDAAPAGPMPSVLPEVVGGVLEDDVDAVGAVPVVDQVLHHRRCTCRSAPRRGSAPW